MRRIFATLLGVLALLPAHAYACGGCFSPPSPVIDQTVVQNAERVLFLRDPLTNLSTVWVEVRYQGLAKDFGWVLPVPKLPTVGVGTTAVLDALDAQMAMRYAVKTLPAENCHDPYDGCVDGHGVYPTAGGADASSSFDSKSADAGGGGGPNVEILSQGTTGPYDYVVVKGSDAQVLYDWLTGHGYAMPDKAKPIIQSHIDQGNVFVAVHLSNGQGVEAIRPIALTMPDAEPCVPLRLTSIASADELNVVVTIAGPGRAVPKNHLAVELNPLRMDLQPHPGTTVPCATSEAPNVKCGRPINFDQVEAGAMDEAGGRAFVTESSLLSADVKLAGYVSAAEMADLAAVTNLANLAAVLATGTWQGKINADLADALEPVLQLAKSFPTQTPLQTLADLRACQQSWSAMGQPVCNLPGGVTMSEASLQAVAVDGKAAAQALQEKIAKPIEDVAKLLALSARVTRLAMRISPNEMDRDPVFAFNPTLPTVPADRPVTYNMVCSDGWLPQAFSPNGDKVRFSIDGLGTWVMEIAGTLPQDPRFKDAPLALTVQVLEESGAPVEIAPGDVPVVSAAIAGAKPGQASLPTTLVLKTPVPWLPAPSDPLVDKVTPWKKPTNTWENCQPKACWVDGELPPWAPGQKCDSADAGSQDAQGVDDAGADVKSGPVPGVDSVNGWVDSGATAPTGDQPVTAKSGCQASPGSRSEAAWLAIGGVAVWVLRRRRRAD